MTPKGEGSPALRVLVMHAGWQAGLACIQSLGRKGHRIEILDQDPASPHRESKYVAAIVPVPWLGQGHAHDAQVERLVTSDAYDLVIPITDADAHLLARLQHRHPQLRNLVVSGIDAVETAMDKRRTAALAIRLGIPVPQSWFPRDIDDVVAIAPCVGYPCVVKLPFGAGGSGVFVVDSRTALLDRMRTLFAAGQQPFVQRFIDGDLLDVTAVADRGRLVAAFTCGSRRRHYVGGTGPFVDSVRDQGLVDIAQRVAAALAWHGGMDIDCLRAPDGGIVLLEVNPRLSGAAAFATRIGIDLPGAYADVVRGVAVPPTSFPLPPRRRCCSLSESEIRWVLRDPWRRLPEAFAMHLSWGARTNIFWSDRNLVRAHWRQIRDLIRAGRG